MTREYFYKASKQNILENKCIACRNERKKILQIARQQKEEKNKEEEDDDDDEIKTRKRISEEDYLKRDNSKRTKLLQEEHLYFS